MLLQQRSRAGQTALHYGATNGHADVVRVLLRRGVDISIRDANGNTAFDLARLCGHVGVKVRPMSHAATS